MRVHCADWVSRNCIARVMYVHDIDELDQLQISCRIRMVERRGARVV